MGHRIPGGKKNMNQRYGVINEKPRGVVNEKPCGVTLNVPSHLLMVLPEIPLSFGLRQHLLSGVFVRMWISAFD